MEITRIVQPASEDEVRSYTEAFSLPPWEEAIDAETARGYLNKFRGQGSIALGLHQTTDQNPFLYVHFTTYDDLQQLISEEFTGSEAFYVADNPGLIEESLAGYEKVCFLSNIHADKEAPVDSDDKPRLKNLDAIIDEAFKISGADCVAYFTHQDTAVYSQSNTSNLPSYSVKISPYEVKQQEGSAISQLALIEVTPKK